MPRHAFVLGGTGQIGRAVAAQFLSAGWQVTVSHRGSRTVPDDLVERGAKVVTFDRDGTDPISTALGAGADVLIDTVAYDDRHAAELVAVQDDVGSFIVISSASVYRDGAGRTLDEAAECGFPEFSNPIPESQLTVDPGPTSYSTRKIALERHLCEHATSPVSSLRPCAIHGRGSRHPREWWLVKRMLDSRPIIPLAYGGESRFHTSAAANIAALACCCAEKPGFRVLNIADPQANSVSQIAALIAAHLNYSGRFLYLSDASHPARIGGTPWSVPRPFVLDCKAAADLGYSPVTSYDDAVGPLCDWLLEASSSGDWRHLFPVFSLYPRDPFDYATEDAFIAEQQWARR